MVKRNAGWLAAELCGLAGHSRKHSEVLLISQKLAAVSRTRLPDCLRQPGQRPHLLGPGHTSPPTPAPLRVTRAWLLGMVASPGTCLLAGDENQESRSGGSGTTAVHSSPYSQHTVAACALWKSQHQSTPADPGHQECSSPKKRASVRSEEIADPSPPQGGNSTSKPGYGRQIP